MTQQKPSDKDAVDGGPRSPPPALEKFIIPLSYWISYKFYMISNMTGAHKLSHNTLGPSWWTAPLEQYVCLLRIISSVCFSNCWWLLSTWEHSTRLRMPSKFFGEPHRHMDTKGLSRGSTSGWIYTWISIYLFKYYGYSYRYLHMDIHIHPNIDISC